MKESLRTIILATLLLAHNSLALAANQHSPDGHGEAQAWFLITKESKSLRISYCVNAKTPSEKKEIEQLVEKSITEWDFFYILVLSTAQDSLHWSTPDGFKMRFLTTRNDTCRGDEDLTVFYGVEDTRVKSVKDSYDSPLGFAHLENYNDKTGDGRGFIWISDAPEVRMHPNHRKALMYHEMGHVFGNGHVEGTIMEEDIAGTITRAYRSGKPFDPIQRRSPQSKMQHLWINFERDLAGWTEIEFSYYSSIYDVKSGSDMQKALTALTGEMLTGNFEVGFQRLVSFPDETDKEWEPKGKGRLQICADKCARDSKYYREFKAEYGKPFWLPLGEEKLFRRIYQGEEQFIPHNAMIIPGVFVNIKTGSRTEFVMSRNGEDPIELYVLVNGEKLRL